MHQHQVFCDDMTCFVEGGDEAVIGLIVRHRFLIEKSV